jgi:alpha-amylase/alpha-mannosidase (GH57 family)
MKTRVAFLWHMHQPMYVDPRTGEAILPWVRLHATHAYYDMARLLARHPQMRVTVNFVPSLIEQLDACAAGTVRERYLELTRSRPENLSPDERRFVIRQFFMANRERIIRALPRYWELLQQRGEDVRTIDYERFSNDDVRDLQVLFNLAWMGFAARADEPEVARLIAKGRGFTEDDKAALLRVQQSIVQRITALWRELAARGQVELSTTPYFHPILPLLCDSDSARRAMPNATLPPRFSHPEDAREQVRLALAKHEETFGSRPKGMWPAEGSVSPEALEIFASEGVKWLATDEGNLFRSTPAPTARGALYQAWSCEAGSQSIALGFRDRTLSDRIGFTYSRMGPAEAVQDFLAQLRRAEMEARKIGIADPVIPVVLDGENAWEHYVDSGEPFLEELYRGFERAPDLVTVTMSEALERPSASLKRIHSGSWIDSNYRIWIGHPEDNLGWDLLGKVRSMVALHEARGDVPADRIAQAKRWLFSAEGSDWFWWYGDDFQTDNAAEFDALFRDRLSLAAMLVGEVPPARLSEPLSQQARAQTKAKPDITQPTSLIHPSIDGRADVYTKWLGAGLVRAAAGQGAMYRAEALMRSLRFGCDLSNCYLRIEPGETWAGVELHVTIANGRGASRELTIPVAGPGASLKVGVEGASAAYQDVVELALPWSHFDLAPRDQAELSVWLVRQGAEIERLPAAQPVRFEVPDADYEKRSWCV